MMHEDASTFNELGAGPWIVRYSATHDMKGMLPKSAVRLLCWRLYLLTKSWRWGCRLNPLILEGGGGNLGQHYWA